MRVKLLRQLSLTQGLNGHAIQVTTTVIHCTDVFPFRS